MSKKRSTADRSEAAHGGGWFLIVGVLAAVLIGSIIYGVRSRRAGPPVANPAPVVAPAPGLAPAPANGPQPVMSQAAPLSVVAVSGNATAVPAAAVTGGARLAADYSRLDFGSKEYREMVNAQFAVTNVGDAPLTIQDVSIITVVGC